MVRVEGAIFDLDGVLVDSMPSHTTAWLKALKDIAGIDIERRDIYLHEGMRGIEIVEKVIAHRNVSLSLASKVVEEKNRIYKTMKRPLPFEGVKEMINDLECRKAVVSGSNRHDVITTLDEIVGSQNFDTIVTADDISKGKPDPLAFLTALKKLRIAPENAVVVENAPLGARAAATANILCYIVLNNTLLTRSDFVGVISHDRIFEKTSSLKGILEQICG